MEEKYFSIKQVVQELINTIQFKAIEKNIGLIIDIDERVPAAVSGDQLRLNQILLNLISNAIKFTQNGEIKVAVRLIDYVDEKARIYFSVKDTGIGISSEKLNTIFESFTQANADTTRVYGGTGLGLAIVKKLIDMLQGAIMVKSKPGEGSEFIFEIDFKVAPEIVAQETAQKAGENDIPDVGSCKLLLADDHPINQLVTSEILKLTWPDIVVEIANDGKEVLEKLQTSIYDIILMDVQMPEMNGLDATRAIRKMISPASGIPILAFTAYATTGEAEKCLAAGMDDYVSKPVSPHILTKKITDLLKKSGYKFPKGGEKRAPKPVSQQIDLNYFNIMTGGDRDLQLKMMEIMMEETPAELALLQQHLNAQNWDGIRAVAHKMKSGIQYLGLTDVLHLVKDIELSAKEKTNLDLLPEKINTVVLSCEPALSQLKLAFEKIQQQ